MRDLDFIDCRVVINNALVVETDDGFNRWKIGLRGV
jgi:hypothetical protein